VDKTKVVELVRGLLVEGSHVWLSDDPAVNFRQQLIVALAEEHSVIRAVGELLAQYIETSETE
jgi:hypothetical protein